MDYPELVMYLTDNVWSWNGVVSEFVAFGFDRSITLTNEISQLTIKGIIHTEKTELDDGFVQLDLTCKDDLTGGKYNERLVLLHVTNGN